MANKKFLKKEISWLHWALIATGKVMIGVGIGMMIASHYWYAQPYWFIAILFGLLVLMLTMYSLSRAEGKKEVKLMKKARKK